ncbi:MAG: PIN domain-containing protein [Acidobacteriota bacterium]
MARQVFFDTNVLVYEFDERDPRKQRQAQELVRTAFNDGSAVVSYQVVQEFLNVMSSKFAKPLAPKDLTSYLFNKLWPMCEIHASPSLFATAISIREHTGYRFYDSLIVAAALEAGCDVLYSEDLQAGRIFQGLEIRNPFA